MFSAVHPTTDIAKILRHVRYASGHCRRHLQCGLLAREVVEHGVKRNGGSPPTGPTRLQRRGFSTGRSGLFSPCLPPFQAPNPPPLSTAPALFLSGQLRQLPPSRYH